MYELSEEIALEKNIKHNIEIVVDRRVVKEGIEKRLTDSLENVLSLADGLAFVEVIDGELLRFSQSFACPDCGVSVGGIEPREVFPLIIRLVPARIVADSDIRWNLT